MEILYSIDSPKDLQELNYLGLEKLSSEIRGFLIENVAKTGGHLASNLGVVELTVALERVYDSSKDRLVFDVGHQCYVHKLLTGRRDSFGTLRCLDGISGFPKPSESIYDATISGHASNSVSVALGMARARTLCAEDYNIVAVIGDGALTGGLAFEGLSDAGASSEPIVIVVNDNGMAIDSNVGGVSNMLSQMRTRPGYINFKRRYRDIVGKWQGLYNAIHKIKEWVKRRLLPHNMFDELGFQYFGPVDGHDISQLEVVLSWAKELRVPAVVHVNTQKGRGYTFAEENPEVYHGVGKFDAQNGIDDKEIKSFSGAFGAALTELAETDEKIVAISASMCSGTGLSDFAEKHPDRFFDVGIAEGHAVTMASGMARQGLKPVFAVYSTFLQRSYDMMIHDVALDKLNVVLAVDRAGIVGRDGETHQGCFDVSYLCSVPNMAVLCPSNYAELREMLHLAIYRINGPVSLRYPRGEEGVFSTSSGIAPAVCLRKGSDLTIISYGTMINSAIETAIVLEKEGISIEIIKLNMINPLDADTILKSLNKTRRLLTLEEVCESGSVGNRILSLCSEKGILLKAVKNLNTGNGIVRQGSTEELYKLYALDTAGVSRTARELLAGNTGDSQ